MPASLILLLARTSLWPMALGATRNADAISAAEKPRMVCRISGARTLISIAGCAQANMSCRRSSGVCARQGQFLREDDELRFGARRAGLPARGICGLAPRDGQQPRFGILRRAIFRPPIDKRGGEGFGQRILGPRHIARTRGDIRDELAVAAPRDRFRRASACAYIAQSGRTSTAPNWAPGQRPAHAKAASRSGVSIM